MAEDLSVSNMLEAPSIRTLSDQIADQLRQAILAGQLKPNQRLVEQEIAESMETSRGPVRDAIKMLANEGLVVRQSHRGTFVAELDLRDVEEIYTLREALESLALKYAIMNATEEQIRELEILVDVMKNLAQQDYSQIDATDIDLEFHHTLCKISGHERVLVTWEALSAQIRLLLLKYRLWDPSDLRVRAVEWHLRIVEAIKKRDVDLGLHELHNHMEISTRWISEFMEEGNKETVDI
jgi:DNA-binding GntR family transcriptional regulator